MWISEIFIYGPSHPNHLCSLLRTYKGNHQINTNSCPNIFVTSKNISLHPAFPRFHSWLQHIWDNRWWLELQSCFSQTVSEDSDTHQKLDLSLPKFVCSVLTHNIKHFPVNSSGALRKNTSVCVQRTRCTHRKPSADFTQIYTEQSHAVKQSRDLCSATGATFLQAPNFTSTAQLIHSRHIE